MNEDKIQLYEVKDCPSFLDFLETIKTYGSRTAFRNYTQVWTYNDLYYKIQKLTSYFSRKETKYYYINIDHPVYFCLAFFCSYDFRKYSVARSKYIYRHRYGRAY